MKDLVSILILSYRNFEGIYESLHSVFEQNYDNLEIVISDDGSNGFKEEIPKINDYIEHNKSDNVKNVIINNIKVNGGTVKNLNSAIDKSNGKYLKVLSAEDVFSHKEAISHYVAYMKKTGHDICFSKIRGITPEGEYVYELLACESDYDKLSKYTPDEIRKRLYKRNFLPGIAWMIDRNLFDKYGKFVEDTRIIEDYPYWIYLSAKGCRFGFLDEVLIDYKLSGVSSAGSYSEMFMNDMFTIYDKYIFPYDKNYGCLQFLYNFVKRAGLNFYMAKARWNKKNRIQKVVCYIKYCPFFVYTGMQSMKIKNKNMKRGKNES